MIHRLENMNRMIHWHMHCEYEEISSPPGLGI
jgi:hypothetical protein